MANAHWFRFMAYLLNWHSNAFIVADWKPDTSDLASYDFVVRTADGGDLYDQMNQQALALVPDNHFTCNRLGQLLTVVDPMLQDSGDRTATVQTTLDEVLAQVPLAARKCNVRTHHHAVRVLQYRSGRIAGHGRG
jgi:hypothetical protein